MSNLAEIVRLSPLSTLNGSLSVLAGLETKIEISKRKDLCMLYMNLKRDTSRKKANDNPCIFIKPIWTKDKETALTAFKLIYNNKQTSQNSNDGKRMFRLDNNRRVVAFYNPKDEAKAEDVKLTSDIKDIEPVSADGLFWSCTENTGSNAKTDTCATNAFLCWKWRKNNTGKKLLL